jgi:hypothetical protein
MRTSDGGDDRDGARARIDPRMRAAWRVWLSALAVDAEAALAAAMAYESLAAEARDAWLDALGEDAAGLAAPAVALYAPLLAVEEDEARRLRMTRALGAHGAKVEPRGTLALMGETRSGERVCAIVSPLYLDFVEVLVCRYRPDRGFVSARRDPIRNVFDVIGKRLPGARAAFANPAKSECVDSDVRERCVVDGVVTTEVPLRDAVEDLAHAVLADRRQMRPAPEALEGYAHLFSPDVPAILDDFRNALDLHLDPHRFGAAGVSVSVVPVADP